ncbi:MAG: PAS domain-containing protein, partial [Pseudomonadota bacterium]
MSGGDDEFRFSGEPIIDELKAPSGVWRLVLLGIFLFAGVALLGLVGTERLGEPIFLAVLGVFASVGVFFLFALVLGLIQFGSRQENSDFSKQLVGQMESGIVVTDNNSRIVFANRSYAALTGARDLSEISSIETHVSRHAEVTDTIYKMVNSAKSGEPAIEEVRLPSGLDPEEEGAHWYRLRVREMEADSSGQNLLIWQVSDVTRDRFDQENAFQTLQDAIHYLDHAPAGFIASEEDGGIVYMNATLADWLGVDLAMYDPSNSNIKDFIPDDNVALFNTANTPSGQPRTNVVDLDFQTSAEKRLPVRIYHRVSQTNDAAPGASRTLVLNRTAELGDGNALRDAEIRFTRFFNNTPVAIAGLNEKAQIIRTNAAFQSMFAKVVSGAEEPEKLMLSQLVAKDDQEQLKALFDEAMSAGSNLDPLEMSINGDTERFVRFYFSHVEEGEEPDDGSEVQKDEHVIIYVVDTTEQRVLENQFAKGQKMQAVGQLAGGIAHDFNNVLTAIIGFSDLLLASHKPSDPSFPDIMNIKQNANRAASLVRQLLAFSRRQTLRPQVLQMSDVLSDLRMLLDRLAGDTVDVSVKHGRDLWPVKADVSQLEQVLVNLVVNARDAMEGDGKL